MYPAEVVRVSSLAVCGLAAAASWTGAVGIQGNCAFWHTAHGVPCTGTLRWGVCKHCTTEVGRVVVVKMRCPARQKLQLSFQGVRVIRIMLYL